MPLCWNGIDCTGYPFGCWVCGGHVKCPSTKADGAVATIGAPGAVGCVGTVDEVEIVGAVDVEMSLYGGDVVKLSFSGIFAIK